MKRIFKIKPTFSSTPSTRGSYSYSYSYIYISYSYSKWLKKNKWRIAKHLHLDFAVFTLYIVRSNIEVIFNLKVK